MCIECFTCVYTCAAHAVSVAVEIRSHIWSPGTGAMGHHVGPQQEQRVFLTTKATLQPPIKIVVKEMKTKTQ